MSDAVEGLEDPFDQAPLFHQDVRIQYHAGLDRLLLAVSQHLLSVQGDLNAI